LRRLRLTLEYDGAQFRGFQRQPGQPTVQGELERRLSLLCGHPVEVTGAGRTDTGVHALGQVVHFDTTGRIPAERVARATNSLGGALVVRHVEETDAEFHARFSALRRTYHYYVSRLQPSPFLGPYALFEPRLRDDAAERLEQALLALHGRHDFRVFAAAGSSGPTSRTIYGSRVSERGGLLRVELTADGFLRSMVRIITGWLIEIGRGDRAPDALEGALQGGPGEVATAPPHGLFLARVEYPDRYPVQSEADAARDWWPGCF
jgi:tRNA pseudouridine38-40 synthase